MIAWATWATLETLQNYSICFVWQNGSLYGSGDIAYQSSHFTFFHTLFCCHLLIISISVTKVKFIGICVIIDIKMSGCITGHMWHIYTFVCSTHPWALSSIALICSLWFVISAMCPMSLKRQLKTPYAQSSAVQELSGSPVNVSVAMAQVSLHCHLLFLYPLSTKPNSSYPI